KKAVESPSFHTVLVSIVIFNAILSLYLIKIHPKVSKRRLNGKFASFLSFVSIGLGQAYNRQLIKSIVFLALYIILIFKIQANWENDTSPWFGLFILFGLPALSMMDANYSSARANKRLAQKQHQQNLQQRADTLSAYHENNHHFALDTNVLMHDAE